MIKFPSHKQKYPHRNKNITIHKKSAGPSVIFLWIFNFQYFFWDLTPFGTKNFWNQHFAVRCKRCPSKNDDCFFLVVYTFSLMISVRCDNCILRVLGLMYARVTGLFCLQKGAGAESSGRYLAIPRQGGASSGIDPFFRMGGGKKVRKNAKFFSARFAPQSPQYLTFRKCCMF